MLDYALLAIVLLSTGIGLMRGLFREAMSLLMWVVAFWIASRYASWLAPKLAEQVANAELRLWVARLVLLIGTLIVGGIATALISMALHATRLGATDRVVGMVFGLARGVLLAGLAVIVLRLAGFTDEPWWRESKLLPYAAPVADALRETAEHGLGRSWSAGFTSSQ